MWMWLIDDGTKTVLSTEATLDLSSLSQSGHFKFQCLASNVIKEQRFTIAVETTIDIPGLTNKQVLNIPNIAGM